MQSERSLIWKFFLGGGACPQTPLELTVYHKIVSCFPSPNEKSCMKPCIFMQHLWHTCIHISEYEQTTLSVDVHQMLHSELEWFRDIHSAPCTLPFQCVLAGHLRLCRALFTCEGVDKKKYGQDLCVQLLSKFLFPASRMIQQSQEPLQGIININPLWAQQHTILLIHLWDYYYGIQLVRYTYPAQCVK